MASTNSTSSVNTNNGKLTRIPSFGKAFKFRSKTKEGKPPPPPPKDNHHMSRILVPDSLSIPPISPVSPYQHTQFLPGNSSRPSQSTLSLVSSSAASARSQGTQGTRQARLRTKASSLFAFVKRSSAKPPKSSGAELERLSTSPQGDTGISTPWNFQHNIHVDEAFLGLPPSWSVQLSQAGFSPEEISAIQARRMNIYSGRPASPNLRINTAPPSTAPALGQPLPGAGSSKRKNSGASTSSSIRGSGQSVSSPPQPPVSMQPLTSSSSSASLHSVRTTTSSSKPFSTYANGHGHGHTMSTESSQYATVPAPGTQHVPTLTLAAQHASASSRGTQHATAPSLSNPIFSRSRKESIDSKPSGDHESVHDSSHEDERLSTPPPRKQSLNVVNAQFIASPPPAYSPFARAQFTTSTPRKKARDESTRSEEDDTVEVTPSHQQQSSVDSSNKAAPANRRVSIIRNKRHSILPPRLSLHKTTDSLDLTSWSASLLSGISSSSSNSNHSSGSPSTSQSSTTMTTPASIPPSYKSNPSLPSSAQDPVVAGHKRQGSKNPPRGIPPIILRENDVEGENDYDDDQGPPPPTGLAEPASAIRISPSASISLSPPPPPRSARVRSGSVSGTLLQFDGLIDKDASLKSPMQLDAALEEANSPILPVTPRLDFPSGRIAGAPVEPGVMRDGSGTNNGLLQPPSLSPPLLSSPTLQSSLLGVPSVSTEKAKEEDKYDDNDNDEGDGSFLAVNDNAEVRGSNRYSSRSSSSTMSTISTATVVGYGEAALVRNASVVRRTSAYVIDNLSATRLPLGSQLVNKPPPSPLSSHFGSEDGSMSGSGSSGSPSQDGHPTPTEGDSPLNYYMGGSYTPLETKAPVHRLVSTSGTFGGVDEEEEEDEEVVEVGQDVGDHGKENETETAVNPGLLEGLQRPKIVIDPTDQQPPPPVAAMSTMTPGGITPLTPAPRYRGWLSAVVKPLEDFIDEAVDPREYYINLQEIAEGESGSVFAAQLANNKDLSRLRLDPTLVAQDRKILTSGEPVAVAVKSVAIVPSGSPKLLELERELKLMRGLQHEHLLSMDALYVDHLEDSLWIRMELMERSLADVVSLAESGLMLHDRMIARLASDVLQALQFLQKHHIAHCDVRSDNLLVNIQGVLKLADFSAAAQVTPSSPMRSDIVGVAYWQAPEVRTPPYNVLKVDVWSLGATIWELAEAEPPFARTQQLLDRWPPLSKAKLFSPAFHDFLRQCSEPPHSRPDAATLSAHSFMKNACGRSVIIQLLAQCMTIEKEQYQDEES